MYNPTRREWYPVTSREVSKRVTQIFEFQEWKDQTPSSKAISQLIKPGKLNLFVNEKKILYSPGPSARYDNEK